jgi:hypothetical protein
MKDGLHVFWLYKYGQPRIEHGKQVIPKQPVTCVASKLEGNVVKYALATHNPHDKFNRATGRQKAIGRLMATSDKHKPEHKARQIVLVEGRDPKLEVLQSILDDTHTGPLTKMVARDAITTIQQQAPRATA